MANVIWVYISNQINWLSMKTLWFAFLFINSVVAHERRLSWRKKIKSSKMKGSGKFWKDRWVENYKLNCALCAAFHVCWTTILNCQSIRLRFNWLKNSIHSSLCARCKLNIVYLSSDTEWSRIQFYRIKDGKVNKANTTKRNIVVTP